MQQSMRQREEGLKKLEDGLLSRETKLKKLEEQLSERDELLSRKVQTAQAKWREEDEKRERAAFKFREEAEARERAWKDEDAARVLLHEQLARKMEELRLQELRQKEIAIRMREKELHLQQKMMQTRKLEVDSSVTSPHRHELAVVDSKKEQVRSVESKKSQSNRMRVEAANDENKEAEGQEGGLPDEHAIDWLQSLELETARHMDRLAEHQSGLESPKSPKNDSELGWIRETSELLKMWLQTGEMLRAHIVSKSRGRRTDGMQENLVGKHLDRSTAIHLGAGNAGSHQRGTHGDPDRDTAKSLCSNSMSTIMAISPAQSFGNRPVDVLAGVRVQVSEPNAPADALSEQCQQLGALLRHRNAHTAMLIREINAEGVLKDIEGSDASLMAMSVQKQRKGEGCSLPEQLAYELDSVSLERSELEEVFALSALIVLR